MDKTSKKHDPKLQFLFAALIMAVLVLAELYVMVNEAHNFVLLAGFAILILTAFYFVIDAVWEFKSEQERVSKELFEELSRSQKASYMLLKKNFDELSNQIAEAAGSKSGDELAEVIKAQKAIAKVTMTKTSEAQDRLFIELNNLEASLNYNIRGLSEKLSGFQEEIERLADHIADMNAAAISAAVKNSQEAKAMQAAAPVEKEPKAPAPAAEPEVTEAELPLDTDILADFDTNTISEDTGAADNSLTDTDASVDDILNQLLEAEKAPAPEAADVVEELAKATNEAPAPTPAPAADNGGKMDQDDIAALIASMTGGDAAAEPEPAPAPAPVMDNPNKIMSPEEIAALIAGM